jgi:hypothetical protein
MRRILAFTLVFALGGVAGWVVNDTRKDKGKPAGRPLDAAIADDVIVHAPDPKKSVRLVPYLVNIDGQKQVVGEVPSDPADRYHIKLAGGRINVFARPEPIDARLGVPE